MKLVSTFAPLVLESDPINGSEGELFYNSASGLYRYFTSGSWVNLINEDSYVTNIKSNIFSIGSSSTAYLSHTISNLEVNGTLLVSSASVGLIVIPDTITSPVGTSVTIIRIGRGTVGITSDGSASILKPSSVFLTSQYSSVKLIKINGETWVLTGEFPDIY